MLPSTTPSVTAEAKSAVQYEPIHQRASKPDVGQSSYKARKTKLLHGTVVERRKTTKEKDRLQSMIILQRGDGVSS